jgi:DNA topoisomerase-2
MIIDGQLIVSKKKKLVLVQELQRLGFKAFPKIDLSKKAGELEPLVDNDESDDEAAAGASDYDYLLGMAIWSLTQERVEKLLRQIGDKEFEIDELIKISPKELWLRDLEEFILVWHAQIEEERKLKKKIEKGGRRGSRKLGLAGKPAKRKAKDESDDEYGGGGEMKKTKGFARPKMSALSHYFRDDDEVKPSASAGADDDGEVYSASMGYKPKAEPQVLAVKKQTKATGPAKSKIIKKDDFSDVDDVFEQVQKISEQRKVSDGPARQARVAAKKTYTIESSDEDDSFASMGDDKLGDVSAFVKGIGTSSGENTSNNRLLFSNTAGRPSSSHGLPRTISKGRLTMDFHQASDSDGIDDTNYQGLIEGSPHRPVARRAGETKALDDEEVDIFEMVTSKPKAIKKKTVPLAKTSKPGPSKVTKPELKKTLTLSPAAKAYAAKQAKLQSNAAAAPPKKVAPPPSKKKKLESDDEDDELANDLLSDDEPVMVNRPSRRAAVVKKTKYVSSDEDEDEEEEDEDSFMDVDESD